jgi:hypothetical protein
MTTSQHANCGPDAAISAQLKLKIDMRSDNFPLYGRRELPTNLDVKGHNIIEC